MVKTLIWNVAELSVSGGLSTLAETFPRSIRETITLVSEVRERYLWVDSLCIVQDDETMKHSQVANMDAICGKASFTTIATGGEDADAGLPRVVPGFQNLKQVVTNYSLEVHLLVLQLCQRQIERLMLEPARADVSVTTALKAVSGLYQQYRLLLLPTPDLGGRLHCRGPFGCSYG